MFRAMKEDCRRLSLWLPRRSISKEGAGRKHLVQRRIVSRNKGPSDRRVSTLFPETASLFAGRRPLFALAARNLSTVRGDIAAMMLARWRLRSRLPPAKAPARRGQFIVLIRIQQIVFGIAMTGGPAPVSGFGQFNFWLRACATRAFGAAATAECLGPNHVTLGLRIVQIHSAVRTVEIDALFSVLIISTNHVHSSQLMADLRWRHQ